MASKGLRVITYQYSRKVEVGYKPSHTTKTLIGYIVCKRFIGFFHAGLLYMSNLATRLVNKQIGK